jgi:hypothetical protein
VNIAQFFLHLLPSTEFEGGLPTGFLQRHSRSDVVARQLVNMKAKFGFKLRVEAALPKKPIPPGHA